MSKYLVDGGTAPTSKRDRAVDIGLSIANKNYPYNGKVANLGLHATQWCVQYLSWLMKAAGCSSYPVFSPSQGSDAESYFTALNTFDMRGSRSPKKGDWVIYSSSSYTHAHVGMITNTPTGTSISTVEGNLSSTIKTVPSYNYNNGVSNFTVRGFGTPTWQ